MRSLIGSLALLGFLVPLAAAPTGTDILRTASGAGNYRTLLNALVATELDGALRGEGPFIVFAPNDAAFDALPTGALKDLLRAENQSKLSKILQYHVVAGNKLSVGTVATLEGSAVTIEHRDHQVFVNGQKVGTPIRCRNGVILPINSVLSVPAGKSPTRSAIEKLGIFKTLLAALDAAELASVLESEVTVFAPTDEAFAAVGSNTLGKLLRPDNMKQLQNLLRYHVVGGSVSAREAVKAGTAKTASGASITAKIDEEGRLRINSSRVIKADVKIGKLTVHVIDRVLMPH
jgi:uncharacterized surface protein with fasciclin (FAS1) repeats